MSQGFSPSKEEAQAKAKQQGVAEGYQFKGPFPFDVDHMHGGRGINLPKAETKKYFTDKKQWEQAVNDINSSKYDDNSDYIGVTGRSTVEINGREWARWSDAQQKGYIELSSMSEQGMAEGSKEKTQGIALSKAYKKDFDDKKPGHNKPETALTGTYSKTGKPGGELKKQGVAEVSDATLTSYLTKLDRDNLKHRMDPTKRSDAKRMKSGPNFVKAFTKLDNRKQGVAEGSSTNAEVTKRAKAAAQKAGKTFDTDVEYRLWYAITTQANAATRKADKKQGVAEGMLDNPGQEDNPVAGAIIRRILMQRLDLLSKYGPEKVGQAVDEVADFVGDTDEIGSSDVSGWVRQVEQILGNMGGQGVEEGSQRVDSLVTDALKIMRGPEVSDAVAALKTVLGDREFNGRRGHYNFYIKQMIDMYGQQGLAESQLDELSFKDIQKGANKFAKGANKFTKNVADTGAAVGNAAGALGGAIKQVGKTVIADPVAATYNATKSGLSKASNVAANTYGDLKKGVQTVGKAGQTVGSDIGAAGTEVGKGIQSVGRGVANVAGGTTGALGSVVGGATTGLGRAAARGFNTGVQNVGGDAIDKMQTNIMTPKVADIQKQIATKQDEIKALQATLAGEQSADTTGGKAGIQTGATALIDPDTELPYEKDKLASLYGYKEPEAAAADNTTPQATAPVGFNASNLSNLPGMEKYAKPAPAPKTPNFAGPQGYAKTTYSVKPPAAPSSPALAAPGVPKVPRVTAGGPTPAEKANLDKRIAAAAPAVAETLEQIDRMLESVNSKKSAEMVKAYVDQRFTELGLRNTTECRNIMARVVQESAIRRRQYAKRLAN
jgi:hypothetical protein